MRYVETIQPGVDFVEAIEGALSSCSTMLVVVGRTIATLVWLSTALWVFAAWGAFRQTYNLGRLRASGATLTWLVLLTLVIQMASVASRLG